MTRWLDHRSSSAGDWPVEKLLAAKGDTRVSVVLPALNEERTVGEIVSVVRRDLMTAAPLVDEIIVIDSGSTDRTAAVAVAAGARVYHRDEILPRVPSVLGKGEVLWRSLLAAGGDVIAFVDADLREFSSAFVRGPLGPLLTDPSVHLVKAMYDRPLEMPGLASPDGGGRVTELVARPLVNLYWPELAGFVQPLGGEYAVRRRLLERLPFPCGYGVELAMLIDTLGLLGLDAMAQVDVGVRKHKHQDDRSLGRMASELWQAAVSRLHREGRVRHLHGLNTTFAQFERANGRFRVRNHEVGVLERPPMLEVAEYARRASRSADLAGRGERLGLA